MGEGYKNLESKIIALGELVLTCHVLYTDTPDCPSMLVRIAKYCAGQTFLEYIDMEIGKIMQIISICQYLFVGKSSKI